jgi:predicted HAD superfamily Cof-like phosphohydrolase
MSYYDDIRHMHQYYEISYGGKPRPLNGSLDELRLKLLREELKEYEDATTLEEKLDALVDLVVVALGAAEQHGFNFNEAWERVLIANMRKRVAKTPEESKRGVIGDLYKPAAWVAPDLSDLAS